MTWRIQHTSAHHRAYLHKTHHLAPRHLRRTRMGAPAWTAAAFGRSQPQVQWDDFGRTDTRTHKVKFAMHTMIARSHFTFDSPANAIEYARQPWRRVQAPLMLLLCLAFCTHMWSTRCHCYTQAHTHALTHAPTRLITRRVT